MGKTHSIEELYPLFETPLPEDSFVPGAHEMDNSYLFGGDSCGPRKDEDFFQTLERRGVTFIGIGNLPEYRRKRNYIGVLLEDKTTFNRFWFHVYPRFFIVLLLLAKLKIPKWLEDADKRPYDQVNILDGVILPDGF